MAERTFKSPGVRAFEIDRSGPTPTSVSGVPAGVIGTSNEGPAFVPVTVPNFSEFESRFGVVSDATQFGAIAAQEWLRSANSLTFVRVLGAGNGLQRSAANGTVTNAGFVTGEELPLPNGNLGANDQANTGPLGRTYFLGCYMSESAGSTVFSDAGIALQEKRAGSSALGAASILRGVLLAPSGVVLRLSCSNGAAVDNQVLGTERAGRGRGLVKGFVTGTVNYIGSSPKFSMLLVGHRGLNKPAFLTASFDPADADYFGKTFNKDPLAIQEHGHLLYTHYDIQPSQAVVTGTGILPMGPTMLNGVPSIGGVEQRSNQYSGSSDAVFLLTGTNGRNVGAAAAPNMENFQERFRTARSPFVVSQKFGGKAKNLFRLHLRSDGVLKGKNSDSVGSNTRYKFSIEGIQKSSNADTNKFGTFDLLVRDFYDTDTNPTVLEAYRGLNIDPSSPNYIGRRIGDQRVYYDFDNAIGSQKLVNEGSYPNVSPRIRVEIDSDVEDEEIDAGALPMGFRGLDHLNTSGSQALVHPGNDFAGGNSGGPTSNVLNTNLALKRVVQPPVPFRENLKITAAKPDARLYWGVQFTQKTSATLPNESSVVDPTILNLTKFFPDFAEGTSLNLLTGSNPDEVDENGFVLGCDRFNNNVFSLENIRVLTGSNKFPRTDDSALVLSWSYVRPGGISANEDVATRALKVDDLTDPATIRLAKFTFPMQQGFDGFNIFNKDTAAMNNAAIVGEMADSNRGTTSGATTAAYRKAVDIMGEKADVDIQLLAVPGIRHSAVSDRAISTVENRFDALYIMDIEERDTLNSVVTGSKQTVNVQNTVDNFRERGLDSSFAAAYFPDVIAPVELKTFDPSTKVTTSFVDTFQLPPSVSVLGAFSLNDSIGYPWLAPAGFKRGVLNATEVTVSLNSDDLDDLYTVDINPIRSFANTAGPIVFGQKTLQVAASALDRVNVRRLLIDVRRTVKQIAQTLIFEPNREATLQRFTAAVTPRLKRVQQLQGIERFKVVIDTTTTTQADIENNTVRGKIFLQPARTAEFISLDFVVTNTGVDGL